MKLKLKTISPVIMAVGLVFALPLLQAQIAPFGISNNSLPPVEAAPPDAWDSIVCLTADYNSLPLLPANQAPSVGTFWTIVAGPNKTALPFPCPPPGLNLPTYEISTGIYLVDDTFSTNPVTPADLEAQATATVNVISQVQTVVASQQMQSMSRAMGLGAPLPGFGGGGGGSPALTNAPYVAPNYGTNLWLQITSLSNVWVNLMVSNTVADVKYEIDGATNLLQAQWAFEGFLFGSETTNWTPTSIAAFNLTNNLFLRIKSWLDSDNIGIPDWWQVQFFGYVGVNPNAPDGAGDGYSIYQKFALGLNPTNFNTPPAPQGVTVVYNTSTAEATVSWLPSPGPVTGYTVTDSDGHTFPESASTYTMLDDISSDLPDPWFGNDIKTTVSVQANYTGGTSAWAGPIPVEQTSITANIVPGPQGTAFLAVSGLPANTAAIRLTEIDYATLYWGDGSVSPYLTNYDIPISSFTNGLYPLPNLSMMGNGTENVNNIWFGQAVGTNGLGLTASTVLTQVYTSPQDDFENTWLVPPFFDGRAQLKQNLIFQLRAAVLDRPFQYSEIYTDLDFSVSYTAPTNYAYAGYYYFSQYYGGYWSHYLDVFLPFEENNFDRNFVFNPSYLDANGRTTTGVGGSYNADGSAGLTINSSAQYWNNGNPLDGPFAYQFIAPTVNGAAISPVLATNQTRWLATYPVDSPGSFLLEIGITNDSSYDPPINAMYPNVGNWFGLHYLSAEIGSSGPATSTLYAGNNTTQNGYFYPETVQPQLGIVEYDYWLAQDIFANSFTNGTDFPGMAGLSATHTNSVLITSVGNPAFQLACYAKMAVTNAYPGVYGYLGQYFQQAYQIDSNGNITTNTTGILSPYGNFFATQPGPAALVTMPDIDPPYQKGTCTVYAISLQLDKHHDTNMINTSFNSPDATSLTDPMVFWCNNNYDRFVNDPDDNTFYDDDVAANTQAAMSLYTPGVPTPDCNYVDAAGNRVISCARDLQDFTRLWVCGITSNLLAALPTGSTITLNWGDVGSPSSGNPTIDLFAAADADGGTGYLTNSVIAGSQDITVTAPYIGRLSPGGSLQLNAAKFANHWAGNYFIWCGVSNGTGGLNLTIADGSGNVLAQTTAYIQIVDIKQMYERWTVGDNLSNPPTNNAVLATEGLPVGVHAFTYPQPSDTNTSYILYVHGWNMETWEKDRFAESAFKRLYWQGYHGRFGVFRWPTGNGFAGWATVASNPLEKDNYDSSEYNAWLSGKGLLNKLNDLNAECPGHVYMLAHSMGNVVAGEALRLAGTNQVVNAYIASQAAVTAHTYDPTVPNYSFWYPPASASADTPNIYNNWFAGNYGGGAGHVFRFYNTNDFALQPSVWQLDQLLKPDQDVLEGLTFWNYGYGGSVNDPAPWNKFYKENIIPLQSVTFDIVNVLTNRYEVMALAAQPYTTALGDTPGIVNNLSQNIDLTNPQIWQPDLVHPNHPFDEHYYHSAQFRGDYWHEQGYWSELLGINVFNLKQP